MDQEICQSCGMPLAPDNRGNNIDGTTNSEYCHFCFKDGQFIHPNLTLEDQTRKLVTVAVENMNMNKADALMLAKNTLPELKRWKQDA